jgi:hypothetical protein
MRRLLKSIEKPFSLAVASSAVRSGLSTLRVPLKSPLKVPAGPLAPDAPELPPKKLRDDAEIGKVSEAVNWIL